MSAIAKPGAGNPGGEYEKLPKIGATNKTSSTSDALTVAKHDCVVPMIENKSNKYNHLC